MLKRIASVSVLGAVAAFTTAAFSTRPPAGPSDPDVTVHEWGTFTSVAGVDGRAIDWLPLGGPADLPCFVGKYGGAILKTWPVDDESMPLTYANARTALWGKVRMETPVLYFYSAR